MSFLSENRPAIYRLAGQLPQAQSDDEECTGKGQLLRKFDGRRQDGKSR